MASATKGSSRTTCVMAGERTGTSMEGSMQVSGGMTSVKGSVSCAMQMAKSTKVHGRVTCAVGTAHMSVVLRLDLSDCAR